MIGQRIETLRRRLTSHRLDAFLVASIHNVRYLTGFTGSNGYCVVTDGKVFFLTDPRYEEQAPREVKSARILVGRGSLFDLMAKKSILPKGRVGIESEHLTVAALSNLRRMFRKTSFVPTVRLVEDIAAVKDETELAAIRKAVEITDAVFSLVVKLVAPGIRESEIAAEITYQQRMHGAEADAFEPIVASGAQSAFPHARATEKRIEKRDCVVLDFGCRVDGYHSDLTRTIFVGSASRRLREIYRVVADAQTVALQAARPGLSGRRLDAIARRVIRQAGFGRYFKHSLGHGIGLQVHENPRISQLSTDTLRCGMVATVEPGVYVPAVGGVRIEDVIVFNEDHCQVLSKSTKELVVV